VLLWGDVRLGNVIFDDAWQPVAVLDWEMTTIGPAEHDVAWHTSLETMQNELFGRAVPGFLDRDALLARYEAQVGRALADLEWFEIFALVRSAAIMTRLAFVQEQAGIPPMLAYADNPVLNYLSARIAEAS
jgi:aminoglycoside phosphotransferase (APT) family kinase protein